MARHSTTGRPRSRLSFLAAIVALLALTPALLALSPGVASATAPDVTGISRHSRRSDAWER